MAGLCGEHPMMVASILKFCLPSIRVSWNRYCELLTNCPMYMVLFLLRPCLCICMRLYTQMVDGGSVSPPYLCINCASASCRRLVFTGSPI